MTDYADTHPCLRERIEALDIDAASLEVPFMAHASAAAVLLGRQEIKLAGELDRQWREDVREEWEKRHAYLTSELAAEYRASLRKKATQLFNAKDWTQLACMRRELGHGLAEYEYSLEHALECDPTYAPSRIMLAQLALERRELEKASFHLEAIRSQEEVAVAYHGISFRIASRKGNIEVARAHLAEHDRELARRWALASEIREITANDCFSPHGLNEFHVGKLRQCLSLLETYLEQAWIVKRTLRGDERQCHWLIVLQPRMSMLTRLLGPLHFLHHPAARLCHDFLEQNELPVPGPYCTYVAEHSSSAVLKALKESLQPGGTEFGIFI